MFNRFKIYLGNFIRYQDAFSLTLIFLLIGFFDELGYGIEGAVRPALRTDLELTYAQIGLLLGMPSMIGSLIEPLILLLGDSRFRRGLIIGGGFTLATVMVLIARATTFPVLLAAMLIAYPASGAFVSLTQASLMDMHPGRQAQAMARWTIAGSIGNLLGPLLVTAGFRLGFGWRWNYFSLGFLAFILANLVVIKKAAHSSAHENSPPAASLKLTFHNIRKAATNRNLLRWVGLLQVSELLLGIFSGYVVLYFNDVVGFSTAQSGLVLAVLMVSSLAADLLLIPLLERFPGRSLIRTAAGAAILIYLIWLLVAWPAAKVGLLVLLRFSTVGWYQVLQAEAYASEPGRSGTVMAISSLGSLVEGGLTWLIGWIAAQAGLTAAMWLLLLGPVGLWLLVPRHKPNHDGFHPQ